jgi:hypothetical protein
VRRQLNGISGGCDGANGSSGQRGRRFGRIFLYPAARAAESVFLKDGSIVEGRGVRENDREVQLALSAGGKRIIPRGEILRTVYHEEYKQKRFIYLMSGEMIEGFIVDEDRETYTYRWDLGLRQGEPCRALEGRFHLEATARGEGEKSSGSRRGGEGWNGTRRVSVYGPHGKQA